jgi:hypothetical protein
MLHAILGPLVTARTLGVSRFESLRRYLRYYLLPTPQGKYEGALISLWLYKENNKLRDWKNVFTLHIPP